MAHSAKPAVVFVTGYKDKLSADIIQLHFEGHGDLISVVEEERNGIITLTFKDEEVASEVAKAKHQILDGVEIVVSRCNPETPPVSPLSCGDIDLKLKDLRMHDSNNHSRTVIVCGKNLREEFLNLLFSNPEKTGGGDIEKIQVDSAQDKATIIFSNAKDAACVVQKRAITYDHHTYHVMWSPNFKPSLTEQDRSVVEVHASKPTDAERFEVLFSNPNKSGGGQIECITLNEDNCKALVTFCSPKDAANVVVKGSISAFDTHFHVQWSSRAEEPDLSCSISKQDPPLHQCPEPGPSQAGASRVTVGVSSSCPIPGVEYLELVFSGEKTGGGPIKKLRLSLDKQQACITYKDPADAARVVKDKYFIVKNKKYSVEWVKDVVIIQGDDLDPVTLGLLYMCKPASGGGEIKDIILIDQNTAHIQFMNCEDAWDVINMCQVVFHKQLFIATWPQEEHKETMIGTLPKWYDHCGG